MKLRIKNIIRKVSIPAFATLACFISAIPAPAQSIRPDYIDWGVKGTDFPAALQNWEKGMKWSDDDNFFISRVRPHSRFRNTASQVNPLLDESVDKKLIFWVPVNNETFNALPDGVFDSEVFPMWAYITHYGNWSAPLARIPAGFTDVAHKNGVAVSPLAPVPYGNISKNWENALSTLGSTTPQKLADFLAYYGLDGIGYNSEFSTSNPSIITSLSDLHARTLKILKNDYNNPLAEFIWYDGTNNKGQITFDRGLNVNNASIWGNQRRICSSLFFNYNWNKESLLKSSVEYADGYGRTPLDLYCGINMQGREPKNKTSIWPLLAQYPLSIGLWGAHSQNMFFESRSECGAAPETNQRTYLNRVIRWFTGATANPVNTPELNNSLIYSTDNQDFFGMSKMMSARSALKWELSDEPFVTFFNLGNGRFFNFRGIRCHDSEWYNIGMQDYMPTWMWWFSSNFLGRDPKDIPADALKAEFVWDDAYMGGSSLRIAGSSPSEYLHLFKTEYTLLPGDIITLRYKVIDGNADMTLALSFKESENQAVEGATLKALSSDYIPDGMWVTKQFVVGKELTLPSRPLSVIALRFDNASSLDLRLGEFSIIRPDAMKSIVATPVIESSRLLAARHGAADGKIIFNMPNDKGDDLCYNLDVNVSLFRLYAQQEGESPVTMGMTPSWAGLLFSIPCKDNGKGRIRLGVSALTPDFSSESQIAWGDWHEIEPLYQVSDEIRISRSPLAPGEAFSIAYTDPAHPAADWEITDADGNLIAQSNGTTKITLPEGISEEGLYNLLLNGIEYKDNGRQPASRKFTGLIQIADPQSGRTPEILQVSQQLFSDSEISRKGSVIIPSEDTDGESIEYPYNEVVRLSYKADLGEGTSSRGVHVAQNPVGFRWDDTGLDPDSPFSISLWFRPDEFKGSRVHLLNIRDMSDQWVRNNFGWFWHTLNEDGTSDEFSLRTLLNGTANYKFDNLRFIPGTWYHLTYVFDNRGEEGILPRFYVNGEEQKVTSWTLNGRQQTGPADFFGDYPDDWRKDNVVAFGGYVHKKGSVDAFVDNFMLWDKALTEQEVKTAMSAVVPSNLPDGLAGYFDFDDEPDSDGLFPNKGSLQFKAGMHTYISTEAEGQASFRWKQPLFSPGSPYLPGDRMEIMTDITWITPGAKVINRIDETDGGSILLAYPDLDLKERMKPFGFPVLLTLANQYGSDSHNFNISLDPSGVTLTESTPAAIKAFPNPFEHFIDVIAPQAGDYRLTLLTTDGRRLLINNFTAEEGSSMRIYPEVNAGLYLLTIEKDNQLLSTQRLIRR